MKRIVIVIFMFASVILSSGCATTTRTASGVAGTAYGFGTGVAKDTKDTTNAIMKADQWFRENWW
ncbi:MAG: hypothetical protein R6U54_05105 [Candidatus Omnitrophota bacterium]